MYGVNLNGANLFKADFENANLNNADLSNCNLLGTNLSNTKLKNIYWGKDFKVINEIEAEQAYNNGDIELAKKKWTPRNHEKPIKTRGEHHFPQVPATKWIPTVSQSLRKLLVKQPFLAMPTARKA